MADDNGDVPQADQGNSENPTNHPIHDGTSVNIDQSTPEKTEENLGTIEPVDNENDECETEEQIKSTEEESQKVVDVLPDDPFEPSEKTDEAQHDQKHTAASVTSEINENHPESIKGDTLSERAVSVSTIPIGPAMISDSQVLEEDETTYAALRGKANTPASVYTELDARLTRTASSISDINFEAMFGYRPSAGVRTQEAFYRKAVDLISARCTSSVKMVSTEPLMGVKDPPPGFGAPRVFFIHQRRPRPMTPLKVWRGYHGNVYFEPMKINQANMKEHEMVVNLPPMNRCSEKLQTVISQSRWNPEHTIRYRQNRLMYTPILQELPPSERFKSSHRPVLVWDKDVVQRDPEVNETLQQLESTGTLRIQTAIDSQTNFENGALNVCSSGRARSPTQKVDKSKVCKGSVARKLVMFRNLMIPLMQEHANKSSSAKSPSDSNSDLHTRESPTKLPSISAKQTRTPVLRIK